MKTRTQNGFMTRFAAMLMCALVLMSAVGFGNSIANKANGFSLSPVVAAQAAEGEDVGSVFDDYVNVGNGSNAGQITVGNKVEGDEQVGNLVSKTKAIAQIILGIATVVSICSLVVCIAKMALAGSNEANRKKAQTGILWSGIALAMFGSLSVVVGFFWSFLTGLS